MNDALDQLPASQLRPIRPVDASRLFTPLHRELISLLRGLDDASWACPTSAGTWNVRQVAAHLLHGDLRKLSAPRYGQRRNPREPSFAEIVELIERDNARGVEFLSGFSPRVITDLLETTGRSVARLFASLPLDGLATTSVAWAGEGASSNWMDVGREFTERWHHQMHIRDAVAAPGLTTRRWLEPVLRLAVFALRRSFATVEAAPGASVVFEVRGTWRHRWTMLREPSGWTLAEGAAERPDASVTMDAETAWRMFFNFCSTEHARQHAVVQGDIGLAEAILPTRSLMIREAISEP